MKHPLDEITGNLRFWVHNGPIVSNLKQLPDILNKMSEENFRHHVNNEKNDFSNWVRDVLGDAKLADEIKPIRNKIEMIKKIKARISLLKRTK